MGLFLQCKKWKNSTMHCATKSASPYNRNIRYKRTWMPSQQERNWLARMPTDLCREAPRASWQGGQLVRQGRDTRTRPRTSGTKRLDYKKNVTDPKRLSSTTAITGPGDNVAERSEPARYFQLRVHRFVMPYL